MQSVRTYVQIGLIVFGFVCLLLGVCLLAWGAVQNKAQAGEAQAGGWLEGLSKLVDSLAKYFPTRATRVGAFFCLFGAFLIGAAFYVSGKPL